MTTFAGLQRQTQDMVKKLAKYYSLDVRLVENIVSFTKCLPKPYSNEIDGTIFKAQMARHFDLTNVMLLDMMYNRHKSAKRTTMSIEDYCKCVCVFLTEDPNIRSDFVFSVYDINRDGELNYYDMKTLLKDCMMVPNDGNTDVDTLEATQDDDRQEIIDILLSHGNNHISQEEFRKLVKKNILYLQFLGPCLPAEQLVEKFCSKLIGKTAYQIKKEFEMERYISLNLPFIPVTISNLYPIILELP